MCSRICSPSPCTSQLDSRTSLTTICDPFLALVAHLGLRLLEDHIPLSGPVCIALVLLYEVDSNATPILEDKDVALTTMLKEWFDRSNKREEARQTRGKAAQANKRSLQDVYSLAELWPKDDEPGLGRTTVRSTSSSQRPPRLSVTCLLYTSPSPRDS